MATRTQKQTTAPTVAPASTVEPTIARTVSSLATGAVVTGTVGYFGMAAVEVVTLSTALLTGSAFLTFMIWYLGAFMLMVTAIMAGSYVQARILDGSLDVLCGKARSFVVTLFSAPKRIAS